MLSRYQSAASASAAAVLACVAACGPVDQPPPTAQSATKDGRPDPRGSLSPTQAPTATPTSRNESSPARRRPSRASEPGQAGPPPTPAELDILRTLRRFAKTQGSEVFAEIPFAPNVWLGLGERLHVLRPAGELAAHRSWLIDVPHFRGSTGPFSAMELLARGKPRDGSLLAAAGRHRHCASPPVPAPARLAAFRRVSVQPEEPMSCLSWWTVDLFLGSDGRIQAVTMDHWEP